jgi:hypothetical protein
MGNMHGREAVIASHKPVPALDLDPEGESKSKTTRFMGIMHGRKTVCASHEPPMQPFGNETNSRPCQPHLRVEIRRQP